MAKKAYETEDGSRIAPLSELREFEVAEGYPDIRGWRVNAADGTRVGAVHELLVDVDSLRTRYLDVRLTSEVAAAPGDRDVLVPVGAARIESDADVVVLPLAPDRVGLLPPYDHGTLSRAHEYEVRRHFSLGQAAATATTGIGATGAATAATTSASTSAAPPAASESTLKAERDFYDHEGYDDQRLFSSRRAASTPAADADVRIPVDRDDTVVLKRGDDGRDEIIIRRPRDGGAERAR